MRNVEQYGEADFEAWLTKMAQYPRFAEAMRTVGDPQSDQAFEDGLALIIEGIRHKANS